ncbi:MAG: hypothetical protein PHP61_06445, partial [Candidatus Izemoplasmatales bacterium]|nr:hypothetical protein [Candidatus Izemoplasmatales bacterium]
MYLYDTIASPPKQTKPIYPTPLLSKKSVLAMRIRYIFNKNILIVMPVMGYEPSHKTREKQNNCQNRRVYLSIDTVLN